MLFASSTRVIEDTDGVRSRLGSLGLSLEDVHQAIRIGYTARLTCNANDPRGFAGLSQWARTTRALRERLAPAGWTRDDEKLAATVDPTEAVAIVVCAGDAKTGAGGDTPKSKFAKGPATASAVVANVQCELFPGDARKKERPTTWVLLVAVQSLPDRTIIRAELSRPSKLDQEGRIADWYERIVLPPIEDNDDRRRGSEGADDGGPEFDAEVHLRTA